MAVYRCSVVLVIEADGPDDAAQEFRSRLTDPHVWVTVLNVDTGEESEQ